MTKIVTSLSEDELFKFFLRRGAIAGIKNPKVKNLILQFGYWCTLFSNWSKLEKSFIFVSLSYQMGKEGGSPQFEIFIKK